MSTELTKKRDGNDFYSLLRDDIISLKLRPGVLFSTRELCEIYQVGRSPAREALIRLEQEGLITFLPQQGTMISLLDLKRIDNERYIRRSVEENIMKDFVGMFSPTIILRLEDMVQEQRAMMKKQDIRYFIDADDDFHHVFFKEIGREHCYRVIDKECCNYRRMRLLVQMVEPGMMAKTIDEHGALLSAVSVRDVDKVMSLFYLHLGQIKNQERKIIKRFSELFTESSDTGRKENHDLKADFLVALRGQGM